MGGEGATNAGSVTFEGLDGGQTSVQLSLEYEPEGIVEKVGDKLNMVDKQAESDLNRFKTFIEDEGYATGAWRGTVSEGASAGAPGIETVTPTGIPGSVFPGKGTTPDATRSANEPVARSAAKPFDQTNGLVDTDGESVGTAVSDTSSPGERERGPGDRPGPVPPIGGGLGQH
ncbi:MAG TPA: hypothetical protein VLR70_09615 [Arthrobacter sp.]|nr:hypothetical protein [Arthrobacter sp.]